MYQHNALDSPPPTSQFRRPWSPDPYDPLPPTENFAYNTNNDDYWEPAHSGYHQYHQQRREPSDVSIEALDLADYARTLRPHRTADPYPAFHPLGMYPPSPRPLRPLASPDSLHPPSLVSRGGTLSTQSQAHSSASRTSQASRRPFSLPPPVHRSDAFLTHSHNSPHIAHSPPALPYAEPEIDISQFPSWSRGWYDSRAAKGPSPYSKDDYIFPQKTHSDSPHRSPFDPGFSTPGHSYPSDLYSYPAFSSQASTRDLLPWSSEPPDHGPTIDPETKEERVKMLQREFGPRQNTKNADVSLYKDADGRPIIGSVNESGKLVTQGPKKRVAVRVLQVMLALTAAIPSIYAAVVIKSTTGNPPPAAKPAAYVLYVLSVVTTLALFYLVIIRPCCSGRAKPSGGLGGPLAGGMMVLPVQRLPGGKGGKNKGGKKGKKGPNSGPTGDLQVNLIVDPNAFRGQDEDSDDEEGAEDEFGDGSIPGGYDSHRRSRPRRRPRRRGVFAGLAMEEQWKMARTSLKKIFLFDIAGVVLWGGAFVFILIGKRCPSGGFNGWCNAYNVSSAAACLLCVTFGLSIFFDIKDLHASKVSPRTRT